MSRSWGEARHLSAVPNLELQRDEGIALDSWSSSSVGAELRMSTIRSNTTVPQPERGRRDWLKSLHASQRAAVAVGEQVEVTPSRRGLAPFLKSDQHVSLDQRLGQLDDRDVRLLLWMARVHTPAPIVRAQCALLLRPGWPPVPLPGPFAARAARHQSTSMALGQQLHACVRRRCRTMLPEDHGYSTRAGGRVAASVRRCSVKAPIS